MSSNPNSDAPRSNGSWDSYWTDSGDAAAFSADGADHPALAGFWHEFFEMVKRDIAMPRLVDLASGNGAVITHALAVFDDASASITSVDVSEQAVSAIRERFPGVTGVVNDAADLSLESGGFDVVTSQFGIEYAGPAAVDEAIRLLASHGYLAALIHNTDSDIHRDCAAGHDAVSRVQESGFFPLALDYFTRGFEAVRGGDRAPYDEAATKLDPAVKTFEGIFKDYGEDVAAGAIAQLYTDVARMHQRIAHYEGDEVLAWLRQMDERLESYRARMASMRGAALDADAFEKVCEKIRRQNGTIVESGPLHAPGIEAPLAWAIVVTS